MKEISCNVIRDLLPLYLDDAASKRSREIVQEHLILCPDCREELALMRSLVTLPPEEDAGLVLESFRARKDKERRRKKIKKIGALAAAVLAVVFCLCYALIPRSWTGIAGTDAAVRARGSYSAPPRWEAHNDPNNPEYTITVTISDRWELEKTANEEPAAEALLNIFNGHTYRADLSNLRNYTPFPRNGYRAPSGVHGMLILNLYSQDYQEFVNISLYSNGVVSVYCSAGFSKHSFLYHTDPGLYEEVAAVFRKYGTFMGQLWEDP